MSAMSAYRHPRRVHRALAGIARVACPPEIEELGLVDAVVDHMALSMASLPDMFRHGLVAGIIAYDEGARIYPENRGRRASDLDYDRALRYFLRWKKSPLLPQHEFAKAVKGLLCIGYYEQQAVKEQIDYRPERWIEKVTKKRLQVYAEPIARHAASLIEPDPLPLDQLFPKPAAAEAAKKEAG